MISPGRRSLTTTSPESSIHARPTPPMCWRTEAVSAEDARAERLLEADAEGDLRRGAKEAVAMNHEFAAGADLDGNDVAGDASGEGDFSGASIGAVLGHEEAATAGDTANSSEESSAARHLRVSGHLDIAGHPGELAGLGDDGVVGFEDEFENRHGGADDATLHEGLLGEEFWRGLTREFYRVATHVAGSRGRTPGVMWPQEMRRCAARLPSARGRRLPLADLRACRRRRR